MSLILIYSCAFLFVKIYAEKSILSGTEPADSSLRSSNIAKGGDAEDTSSDTFKEDMHDEPVVSEPVENIVYKINADGYPMLMAAATHVSDIEVEPASGTPAVTAPPVTSETHTSTTPLPETTKAPETQPPETASTEQSTDNLAEDMLDDGSEEEVDEYDSDENMLEEPDESYDDGSTVLSPEELQDLLDRLGVSGSGSHGGESNPNDVLYSVNSYKDQTLTYYDTTLGRMRTDNAFEIVCQVTSREISSSYDPEAIKAQAIAVYSYIKHYEQEGRYAKIGSKSDVPDIIVECVEAIDGLAMFYGDEYIMAAFSSSTGGFSASSKNVWGEDVPYLQSVQNDFDQLDERYYGLATTYTVDELRQKIESNTDIKLSNNYSEWIRVLSHHDYIYADSLSIDGHTTAYISGKERTITGYVFRTYILGIRSTAFTVSYSNGVFTFTTYGYGHGVGMSQVGANLYAKYGGYTFDQILHHYYTNVTIR